MKNLTLFVTVFLLTATLFFILSCNKDEPEPKPDPDFEYMLYENNAGEIGKAGGKIEITDNSSPVFGASVEIPEGALEETKNIQIEKGNEVEIDGKTIPIIRFLPDGIEFNKEVKISVPANGTGNSIVKHFDLENGLVEEIEPTTGSNSGSVYAYTTHFSNYAADNVWLSVSTAKAENNYLALGGHIETSLNAVPFTEDNYYQNFESVQHYLDNLQDPSLYVVLEYKVTTVNSLGIMGPTYMKKNIFLMLTHKVFIFIALKMMICWKLKFHVKRVTILMAVMVKII